MPTPAEEVARMFWRHEGEEPDEDGPVKSFSVRLPGSQLAWIDSLASAAELSRNAMANHLLRVGISAVLAHLPDPVRDDVDADVIQRLGELDA